MPFPPNHSRILTVAQLALRHWSRIIQRWPVDKVRPEAVSFQTLMKKRIERATNPPLNAVASNTKGTEAAATPEVRPVFNEHRELQQVNALYSLLENRFATQHPIPEELRYPASRTTHYDDFLRELEEAPSRTKFDSFMQRLKGRFRIGR